MTTDVWSTALATLALHAAGEPYDGPTLGAARRYLLGAQNQRPMALVNQRRPGAVRTGGWSFQRGNELMPDTDDTGLVLAALGRARALARRGRLPRDRKRDALAARHAVA